jgi:hypothetical protein
MKNVNYLFTLFLLLSFIACDPNQESNNESAEATEEAATQTSTEQAPDPSPKEQAAYDFVLIPGVTTYDEATLVPSTEIYLTAPQFPEAHLLVKEFNFNPIEKANWSRHDIPADAVFAFQSWFAGGGGLYYGLLKGTRVELYRRYLDEGLPEEETTPEVLSFEHIKTIDLENTGLEPGYFICYQADKQPTLQLAIYHTSDGRATSLIYKGQQDYIPLQFTGEEISTEGIIPNITQHYLEIFDGQENGKLKLTHSGNWDYASYTRGKDGKTFDFTIDHDLTIVNDTYRTTPCFE